VKEDETSGACSTYGRYKNAYKILVGKARGRDLGVDGRLTLKWALRKEVGWVQTEMK